MKNRRILVAVTFNFRDCEFGIGRAKMSTDPYSSAPPLTVMRRAAVWRSLRGNGKTMLGAYAGEWPKAASTGGGAAGPAIDRVKSTTSHYSSTTPPRPLPPHTAVLRDSLPPSRCCYRRRCCYRCRCCSPIPLSTLVLVVLSYGRTG